MVSPKGKVLSSHQAYTSEKTWAAEVAKVLEEGIKAFGPVQARKVERADPTPFRGIGVEPSGAATLAIYTRLAIKGIPLREVPDPTIDHLTLTGAEFAALAPPSSKAGSGWTIPQAVARKFNPVLGPRDEDSMPRPQEVSTSEFKGKVLLVQDQLAYLGFQGQIAGTHATQGKKQTCSQAKLVGVGVFDLKSAELRSVTWVFDGTYRGPGMNDQPQNYHAVVEWRRQK